MNKTMVILNVIGLIIFLIFKVDQLFSNKNQQEPTRINKKQQEATSANIDSDKEAILIDKTYKISFSDFEDPFAIPVITDFKVIEIKNGYVHGIYFHNKTLSTQFSLEHRVLIRIIKQTRTYLETIQV